MLNYNLHSLGGPEVGEKGCEHERALKRNEAKARRSETSVRRKTIWQEKWRAEIKLQGRGLRPFGTNLAQMTGRPSRNAEILKIESAGNP